MSSPGGKASGRTATELRGDRAEVPPTIRPLRRFAPLDTLPMFIKLGSADTGTLMSAVKVG